MDKIYGSIETQISENNDISTVLYGNNQQIATYTSEVPQIQTIIQQGCMPVVSILNEPFIEVTSVNGMTGDVITEPIIKGFQANHYYLKDTVISKNGKLYLSNETFTSEEYFNIDDWTEVTSSGQTIPAYDKIEKKKDYLFETWYSNLDYTNAKEYFQSRKPTVGGACTSIRKGKFFARNYDWTYDENAEFIVRTPRANGYYATMGIGGSITGLTNAVVTAGEPNELYKLVPFFLQDGINEFGLTVSTNVTPGQHGNNNYVNPTGTVKEEICSIMLPRYILDHYQTASEAVTDIQEHLKIFTPKTLGQMGYDQQYLIADKNETYVLEFNEGGYVIVEHNFITNFYIADVNFNPDGSVWTPADAPTHLPSSNNITSHGMGLERYNLVNSRYASLSTKQDFINLLSDLYYTKCYTTAPVVSNPFWYTECIDEDLTVDSPASDFNHVISVMAQRYTDRTRTDGGLTWQTVHSSLYDMEKKKLYLRVQEENGDTEYVFDFFYTAREVDNLLEDKVDKIAGKGLSTNDYTTNEKTKLGSIESGAQKNVQSNWTQTNTSADDYIKNKPINLVSDASYVHTDNNFTTTLKNKLNGVENGAQKNIQSDWNQTNINADDYIKNKPHNIKLLSTIPYSSFGSNFSTSYKFDVLSHFCDFKSDRIRRFDVLLVNINFNSDSSVHSFLRWGGDTNTYATAVHRQMITIENGALSFADADNMNLIFTSSNVLQETLILFPMIINSQVGTSSVDDMGNNIGVSHLFGTQASSFTKRYNIGSWVRINNFDYKIPMWFTEASPTGGDMKIYGIKYE